MGIVQKGATVVPMIIEGERDHPHFIDDHSLYLGEDIASDALSTAFAEIGSHGRGFADISRKHDMLGSETAVAMKIAMRRIYALADEGNIDISRAACCTNRIASEMGFTVRTKVWANKQYRLLCTIEKTDLGNYGELVKVRLDEENVYCVHVSMLEHAISANNAGWSIGDDVMIPPKSEGDEKRYGVVSEIEGDLKDFLVIKFDDEEISTHHYMECVQLLG